MGYRCALQRHVGRIHNIDLMNLDGAGVTKEYRGRKLESTKKKTRNPGTLRIAKNKAPTETKRDNRWPRTQSRSF